MRPGKRKGQRRKNKTWSTPNVLSLILGVLGIAGLAGLVELCPQIDVLEGQPTQKEQPFSVPFQVKNIGYSSFYVERVFYYAREIKVGRINGSSNMASDDNWGNKMLDKAQSEPITYRWMNSPHPPDEADIVIVVDNRVWKWFPYTSRRYFRFKRFEGPYDGTWQWLKQPTDDIEEEVDKRITTYLEALEK